MLIKSNIKISSNRNFGLVFFFIFLVVSIWPLTHNESPRIWSAIISLAFLILVLTRSKLLTPLNRLWAKFGIILGSIIAPIVMGVVFFLVITPIGLLVQLFSKDQFGKSFNRKASTYWVSDESGSRPDQPF